MHISIYYKILESIFFGIYRIKRHYGQNGVLVSLIENSVVFMIIFPNLRGVNVLFSNIYMIFVTVLLSLRQKDIERQCVLL